MHWRSYRPSLLTTTAGSSVAYHYEQLQVVGMTGRVGYLALGLGRGGDDRVEMGRGGDDVIPLRKVKLKPVRFGLFTLRPRPTLTPMAILAIVNTDRLKFTGLRTLTKKPHNVR